MAGTGGFDVTYTVGFLANATDIYDTFAKLGTTIPPIKIPALFPNVNTGNAQALFTQIQRGAQAIDKVIIKTETWKDAAGHVETGVTRMITSYIDAAGKIVVKNDAITSSVTAIKNAANSSFITSTEATQNFLKPLKETESQLNKNLTSFRSMNDSAVKWYTKAEGFQGKDKKNIQDAALALQNEAEAYELLAKQILETEAKISAGAGSLDMQHSLQWLKQEAGDTATNIREKLNPAFIEATEASKRSAMGTRGFAQAIKDSFRTLTSYGLTLAAIRKAQQLFNKALEYTIQLNKEMINIQVLQVEGAQTIEQIQNLAIGYNNLAHSMGVTTLEVAKGSVEWLRQGKTISETQELMRASMMLSKLGAMDSADATEALTSTLNSYKMSSEAATSVVDKLIAVDNTSATSAYELATALRYVAAVAGESGVSLDELISYIGVMSSTTRLNAEQIGQALKTMLTRMQDIRSGKLDEDGLGINNVAIALKKAGIELMKSKTQFRDFSDVLEEIASNWETLGDTQKAEIAKAVAGVRQANLFRVLMQNMNQALILQTSQTNAAGLAWERYKIYLQGVEAAQNRVKASFEGLAQDAIKGELIVSFYDAIDAILQFIDAIGGLNTLLQLTGVIIGTIALRSAITGFINLATAIRAAGGALTYFNSVITASIGTANPVTLALTAVAIVLSAVIVAFNYASTAAERHVKKLKELSVALEGASISYKSIIDAKKQVNELWAKFQELTSKKEGGTATAEELKELVDVQNQLNKLSGGEILGTYDAELNYIVDKNQNIQTTLDLLDQEIEKRKILALNAGKDAAVASNQVVEDANKKIKQLEDSLKAPRVAGKGGGEIMIDIDEIREQINELEQIRAEAIANIRDTYKTLQTPVERERFRKQITDDSILLELIKYDNYLAQLAGDYYNRSKLTPDEIISPIPADFTKTYLDLVEILKQIDSLKKKIKDNQFLSEDEISFGILTGILSETKEGWEINERAENGYLDGQLEIISENETLSETQKALLNNLVQMARAQEEYTDQTKETVSALGTLKEALKEQEENGEISFDTMMRLVDAGYAEALSVDKNTGRIKINSEETKKLALAKLYNAAATAELLVQQARAEGLADSIAAGYQKEAEALWGLYNVLKAVTSLSDLDLGEEIGGGGGGGSATSWLDDATGAIKKEQEAIIEMYKKQQDALRKQLEHYKKIIDARKDLLKSLKEEADYKDELEDKEKSLSRIQNELLELSLDNSEEAAAKRLELQEELQKAQDDLDKTQRDRQYDLQMEALDKELELYTDFINSQIEALDLLIEAIETLINDVDALARMAMGQASGGGAWGPGGYFGQWQETYPGSGVWIRHDADGSYDTWRQDEHGGALPQDTGSGGANGGLVTGGISGKDSVPILTMPGEFILNKHAVDQLGAPLLNLINKGTPSLKPIFGNPGLNVGNLLTVNVSGNLDENVIPDLEKLSNKVLEKLNYALYSRGYKRTANQYIS
jgi:TP901 family phage tail tape measure protein